MVRQGPMEGKKGNGKLEPCQYYTAANREKSEALLQITVVAPGALWVGACCATLIYPGPRARTGGKINEVHQPTAASAVGFALDLELCSFFAGSIQDAVMAMRAYLAARGRC